MTEVIVVFREDFGLRIPFRKLVDRLERCREIGMTFEAENVWTGERIPVPKDYQIKRNHRFRGTLNSENDFFTISRIIADFLEPCANGIDRILVSEKNRIPKSKS